MIKSKINQRPGYSLLLVIWLISGFYSLPVQASDDPIAFDVLKVQNCRTSAGNGIYKRIEDTEGELATFQGRSIYQMVKSGKTYSLYYRNDSIQWVLDKTAVEDNNNGTFSKVTTREDNHPSRAIWNNRCRIFPENISLESTANPAATGNYTIVGVNKGLPLYQLEGQSWKLYYNTKGKQWVLDSNALSNRNFKGVVARAQKGQKNLVRATWTEGYSIEPTAEYHYRRLEEEQEPWSLSLASWNMNNYGQSKGNVDGLVDHYASIITKYDIVFIQEIKEPSPPNDYWTRLCQRVRALNPTYVCLPPGSKAAQSGAYYQSALFYLPAPRGKSLTVSNYGDSPQPGFTRQPLLASFSYQYDVGKTFDFGAYSLHASLGNVNGELTNLQNNVALMGSAVVLGDLNGDCNYFSAAQEVALFNTWDWWITKGQKTNVRGQNNCAYDRIITRGEATQNYASHHILTQGISFNPPMPFDNDRNNPNAGQSNKRISDHYLVAIEFGGVNTKKKKRKLEVTVAESTGAAKKIKKDLVLDDANPTITTDVIVNPGQNVAIHAVYADIPVNFGGNELIYFSGFSARKIYATADSNGLIPDVELEMYRMAPFPHRLVVDVNDDGIYDRNAGDYVNPGDAADFTILSTREDIDDIFTLDDNGNRRERFNINVGKNVFALGHNLGNQGEMDIYILSQKKLRDADKLGWNNSISSLDNYAITIEGSYKQSIDVTGTHSFYENVWPDPSDLFTRAPDNADSATTIAEYGRNFNVVVDVNRNGQFDPGTDKVDAHTISHLKNWADAQAARAASQRESLRDSSASYPMAVKEFKEFLNAKMGLQLDTSTSEYDNETAVAAIKYNCSSDLTFDLYPIVEEGAKIGFQLFSADEVYEDELFSTNTFHYADVDLISSVILKGQNICAFVEDNVSITGIEVEENATATFVSGGKATIDGEVVSCNGVALVTGAIEEVAAVGLEFVAGALTVFSFGSGAAPAAGAAAGGILIGSDGATRIVSSGCI